MVSTDGEPIAQEINKKDNGYTISFRTSKKYFNAKEGVHGLKLTAMPKNAEAGKKEQKLAYKLEASDYPFKEFNVGRK
ncbi:MAG: hypothetical protein H0W84_04510 [Bacteroidetes bacterium]|nr:hypothetical protein [Bacteroidota bacterium]